MHRQIYHQIYKMHCQIYKIYRKIDHISHKANKIIDCDGSDEAILAILNGRKITSFYLNIMYPHKVEFVTIDRHALSIALGYWISEKDYAGMTANQYNFFEQCFTLAAMKADISPVLMQSSTWVRWRKIKKEFKGR